MREAVASSRAIPESGAAGEGSREQPDVPPARMSSVSSAGGSDLAAISTSGMESPDNDSEMRQCGPWSGSRARQSVAASENSVDRGRAGTVADSGPRHGPGLAGIDGCRAGWFCVTETAGRIHSFATDAFATAIRRLDGLAVIAVDIPIGLPQAGPRDCDLLARRRLGPRRGSSVFPAPLRGVLDAADHAAASARHRDIDGRGMSRQSWNITPKIVEVDRVVRAIGQSRVREVHPEISFRELAGRPMHDNKKRPAGHEERLGFLRDVFSPADLDRALRARPSGQVARDDVIDAFVCLWSARRILAGRALRLPPEPQRDATGLDMAIWA